MLTDLCPDCAARPTGEMFQHAESCPLVRDIGAQAAADTEWFAQHPGCDRFTRLATVAEREVLGVGGGLVDVVRPVQGGDGG